MTFQLQPIQFDLRTIKHANDGLGAFVSPSALTGTAIGGGLGALLAGAAASAAKRKGRRLSANVLRNAILGGLSGAGIGNLAGQWFGPGATTNATPASTTPSAASSPANGYKTSVTPRDIAIGAGTGALAGHARKFRFRNRASSINYDPPGGLPQGAHLPQLNPAHYGKKFRAPIAGALDTPAAHKQVLQAALSEAAYQHPRLFANPRSRLFQNARIKRLDEALTTVVNRQFGIPRQALKTMGPVQFANPSNYSRVQGLKNVLQASKTTPTKFRWLPALLSALVGTGYASTFDD